MTYKTIVAYFDNPERAKTLLSAATRLAEAHQAHLIGLYVVPPVEYYVSNEYPVPYDITNYQEEIHRERAGKIETIFEAATGGQTYPAEWRYADHSVISVVETVSGIANTADLLMMSQPSDSDDSTFRKEIPEQVLLATSRPVVLVPETSNFSGLGSNMFVAFDGSKESTRAIFDAMPLLQKAENVAIHQVNPSDFERHHVLGTSGELISTLSRHGIEAVFSQSEAKGSRVSDELMLVAQEKGADLIVMGAYGHSRLRERMFGGTTRAFLKEMRVPVLMSC